MTISSAFPTAKDVIGTVPDAPFNQSQTILINGVPMTHRDLMNFLFRATEAEQTKLGAGNSAPTNVGDYLRVSSAGATQYAPGDVVILDQQVGTGSSNALSFSSIPAGYRRIQIELTGRSTNASSVEQVRVQFNGVTGSSYYRQLDQENGATATISESGVTTFILAGFVPGASSPANWLASIDIQLPRYADTTICKPVRCQSDGGYFTSTGGVITARVAGMFDSTAAISSIGVFVATGNWTTSTIATLRGWA